MPVTRPVTRPAFRSTISLLPLVLLFAALQTSACKSSKTDGTTANDCVGGVVVGGQCQGKCDPSLCVADNTCVANQCRLKCSSHLDCDFGQACTPVTEDGTGASIQVCLATTATAALGSSCINGNECGSQLACPDGVACGASSCNGGTCTADPLACAERGTNDSSCRFGTCDDGTPCVVPSCADSDCKPLKCVTSGKGDATAYCTRTDCVDDSSCGPGYQCATVRDPHPICNTKKGNSNACGTTKDACIDQSHFSDDGATYVEGPICLMHKQCAPRAGCDACQSDLDCSLIPGRHCVQGSCSADCKKDSDCLRADHCVSGACVPRFSGGCVGSGKFCEPCRTDLDCGDASSRMACINGAAGERVCFDLSFPTSCTSDSQCPTAPSGLHGHCLNENDGLAAGDAAYHKCYLPIDDNQTASCWPSH